MSRPLSHDMFGAPAPKSAAPAVPLFPPPPSMMHEPPSDGSPPTASPVPPEAAPLADGAPPSEVALPPEAGSLPLPAVEAGALTLCPPQLNNKSSVAVPQQWRCLVARDRAGATR